MPPEVERVTKQDLDLWKAGAATYAVREYEEYKASYRKAREHFIKEKNRFRWFRDYDSVSAEYSDVLNQGQLLARKLEREKKGRAEAVSAEISALKEKLISVKELTVPTRHDHPERSHLVKAELAVDEAEGHLRNGRLDEADVRVKRASDYINRYISGLKSAVGRLDDEGEQRKWQDWVNAAVGDSRKKGGHAIIVSKIDRTLLLYRNGQVSKSYPVGLGFAGLNNKLHAGDRATPEGRYKVIKKIPRSKFHRALLINYPNEEDKRRFSLARKRGEVPEDRGIGNLIEIHGGGGDSLTYGCVALDNNKMEELYSMVEVGTPVVIVGALDNKGGVLSAIKDL